MKVKDLPKKLRDKVEDHCDGWFDDVKHYGELDLAEINAQYVLFENKMYLTGSEFDLREANTRVLATHNLSKVGNVSMFHFSTDVYEKEDDSKDAFVLLDGYEGKLHYIKW